MINMESLDDIEAICVIYALYKRKENTSKKVATRRHWVHPLNLKRPIEG